MIRFLFRRGMYLLSCIPVHFRVKYKTKREKARQIFLENPYNKEGIEPAMEKFDLQGRRVSVGGAGISGLLEKQLIDARMKEAAEDTVRRNSVQEDAEILAPLRSYHVNLRARFDAHILEAIQIRDGFGEKQQDPAYSLVVSELQRVRISLFGSPYDEPEEDLDRNPLLAMHESLNELKGIRDATYAVHNGSNDSLGQEVLDLDDDGDDNDEEEDETLQSEDTQRPPTPQDSFMDISPSLYSIPVPAPKEAVVAGQSQQQKTVSSSTRPSKKLGRRR